ncbi:hypothetical protein [Streptomyces sp. NPDC088755]|uniref:hypothetical protein n=1 Tax=Streptomyces sp. NPDC088755 TaxID=3365888 RepID=UPI0037FD1328
MASTVGGARGGSVLCRQFLLLAAVLFGIVTMHTVGHPAEHEAADAHPAAVPATDARPTIAPVADAHPPAAARSTAPDAGHPSHGSPDDAPMSGMDPLSVCLAVLGAWGLALVGGRLLGLRADGRPLGTPVGAGLARALRPNPPPPLSVLAAVSVLRI